MATINFLIKSKNNPSAIFTRFKHANSIDLTCSTSLIVNPAHWSKPKQKVKEIASDKTKNLINKKLEKLKPFLFEKFNETYGEGKPINHDWLKLNTELFFGRSTSTNEHEIYFTSYFKKFINEAPDRILNGKNKSVSSRTISKYNTTHKRLLDFEKIIFKRKIKFSEIDLSFHKKYLAYMFNNLKYGGNTVGKDIGIIITVCNEAKTDNISVNSQFESKKFYVPREDTKDVYLNDVEIDKIFKHNFSNNERLDNTRDIFIIGLRTGLRVSDFTRLKTTNLKRGMIEVKTFKTNSVVTIPLHPQVSKILAKRGGEFPRMISDVKFNEYVKEVCEIVGITNLVEGAKMTLIEDPRNSKKTILRKQHGIYSKHELVSSHTCRRSFSSNLHGKLDTPTIMAITGHKTEKNFLKYIKVTPEEHAKKLDKFWKKQAENKGYEQDNLKVV